MNIFTKISNWWKALFNKKTIDTPTIDVPQSSASHIYVPQAVLESPQVAPIEMANVSLSKPKKKKRHVPSRGRVQYYKRNNVWINQYDVFIVDLDLIGLLEELVLLGFNPDIPFYYDDQYAPNDYAIMYPPTTDGVVCEPINLFDEPLTVDDLIESPAYNPVYNEPVQENIPVQNDPVVVPVPAPDPDPAPTYVSYTPSYSSNDDNSSGSSSSSSWGSSSDSSSSSSSWSDSSSSCDYSSSDSSSYDSSSSGD